MNAAVATLELNASSREGEQFAMLVAVGTPVLVHPPSTYGCDVEVTRLLSPARCIQGEGSLQALCLAVRLALELMASFVAEGGALSYPNGESFPLEAYAIGLLQLPSPARDAP